MLQPYRRRQQFFSESLKRKICEEVSEGIYSQEEARRFYNIQGKSNILCWMRKFGYTLPDGRLVVMSKEKDSSEDPAVLKARISALERELADAKLRARILDTALDIIEEEHNIKVRKKPITNRSNDSE